MAKTVRDTALLLEAIGGPDGVDDRQPPFLPPAMLECTKHLDEFLSSTSGSERPLTGMKIGILEEGFSIPNMDPNIRSLCASAVSKFKDLGAGVITVSVPPHSAAAALWMCSIPLAGGRQGLLNDMSRRKQLYFNDRIAMSDTVLTQETFDALSPGGQNLWLRYLYLEEKYGAELHGKCSNLLRKLNVASRDDYDRALASVDVLVMPTLPSPPCKLLTDPPARGPLERLSRNMGLVGNTAPFNSTGHPALRIPVGFVPAPSDKGIKLPAGLQFVGKKFKDIECLKVEAPWERTYKWQELETGFQRGRTAECT